MGDPVRLLMLEALLEVIESEKLVENARVTGDYLLAGLKELQAKYPTKISNARGQGTICAIDCPTGALRDAMIDKLRLVRRKISVTIVS